MVSRAIALLFLLLCFPFPAKGQVVGGQPLICTKTFQVSQGAVALTRIVTGVSGQVISICGWDVNAGAAAGTWQLESGTGTNCGTGTTVITPAYALGINGVQVDHPTYASISLPQLTGGVTTDLCLVTTGTGPIQFLLYYGQF
jgi:hypothetical protein